MGGIGKPQQLGRVQMGNETAMPEAHVFSRLSPSKSAPDAVRAGVCLADTLSSIGATVRRERHPVHAVPAVATQLREAIGKRAFLSDVIEAIVPGPETPRSLRCSGLIRHPDEDLFTARVMFWPAGFANEPHAHRTWAATGVLLNELCFRVRGSGAQTGECITNRLYHGVAGQVGSIASPCVHQVENPATHLAVSLSLFGRHPFESDSIPPEMASTPDSPEDDSYIRGLERRFVEGILALIATRRLTVPSACLLRLVDAVARPSQALIVKHLVSDVPELSPALVDHIHHRNRRDDEDRLSVIVNWLRKNAV